MKMGLSCGCNFEWDGESVALYNPRDFVKMPWFDRRKKCMSCGKFINTGEQVAKFEVFRGPQWDYEINRFGEGAEIQMADRYYCGHCSEIFFNLDELGFCINTHEKMDDVLAEYKKFYLGKENKTSL
jgi:hypothetical protein